MTVVLQATAIGSGERRRIDPRTSLAHILILGALTLTVHGVGALAVVVATVAGCLLLYRQARSAAFVSCWFAVLVVVNALILPIGGSIIATSIGMTTYMLLRVTPMLAAALMFTKVLSVSDFLSALTALRVPRSIIVPLAVMLRFIPTIGYEMSQIRDALAVRGRPLTIGGVARAPMEMTELVLVPLIMRCLKVAEELSASAVTRGIENPVRRTSRRPLRFGLNDAAYAAVVVVTSAMALWLSGH